MRRQLPVLDWKDILPLGIEVINGILIAGNASTPNLLVTEFARAVGTYGHVESRSKFDLYKEIYSFKLEEVLVRLEPNDKYAEGMSATGRLAKERVAASESVQPNLFG